VHLHHLYLRLLALLCLISALTVSCGEEKKKKSDNGPAPGRINQIFTKTADEFGIPKRMLLAIAFKESRLNPQPQSVAYGSEDNTRSIFLAQTAFGISHSQLALAPERETSRDLAVQTAAYAQWVRSQMADKSLTLNPTPGTPAEKFDWIWFLSQIHRTGQDTRRNVQILFAYELMDKLNSGDMWQDPESGEMVVLEKEPTPLNVDSLEKPMKESLKLYVEDGDIFAAQYFELSTLPSQDDKNVPTHIKVIHCPFELSACLEMQQKSETPQDVKLNAHYIIPPNQDMVTKPLQVLQHRSSVETMAEDGTTTTVNDAIVILLTGNSGHYERGQRTVINPQWITKWQLSQLGKVVRHVCPAIKKINPLVEVSSCLSVGGLFGVRFSHQGASSNYQWGNIPDFDEDIFSAYIQTPDALSGNVSFSFPGNTQLFDVGEKVSFDLKFMPGTTRIDLEQLQTCADGKTIWNTIHSYPTRKINTKRVELPLFEQGPNHNGEHYLRAMVYGAKGELMGWETDHVIIKDYDRESPVPVSLKKCGRNGT
jgi:hypothetical protein